MRRASSAIEPHALIAEESPSMQSMINEQFILSTGSLFRDGGFSGRLLPMMTKEEEKEIFQRLEWVRANVLDKCSKSQFAKKLGLNNAQAYNNWQSRQLPSGAPIEACAALRGNEVEISLDWLVFGEGPPPRKKLEGLIDRTTWVHPNPMISTFVRILEDLTSAELLQAANMIGSLKNERQLQVASDRMSSC